MGGSCGECCGGLMWYGVCVCVVAGFSVQAVQGNEDITMLVSQLLPAGEISQVKRIRGREEDGKGKGRDLKAKTSLSSVMLNIYCFKKIFTIFDVLLSSTWTVRSLKLKRTKPGPMKHWKCHQEKEKKRKKNEEVPQHASFTVVCWPFCFALLILRPAFPKVNTVKARLLA